MKYFVRAALVAALIVAGTTSHAQAQALQSAAFDNEITAADVTCYTFNSNLTIGSQGGDVMALQIYLAQKGFLVLPAGQTPNINSYFGRLTKAAVAKYQSSVGISSSGYVGPLTRGSINTEFACSEGGTTSNDSGSNSGTWTSEESQARAYASNSNAAMMIVGKPTISLERGINNEETGLVARFDVLVAPSPTKTAPLYLMYTGGKYNYVSFEGKNGEGGSVNSLQTQIVPGKNVTVSNGQYGPLYTVAPNTVGRMTFIGRVNTKELFAGTYHARLPQNLFNIEEGGMIQVVNAGNKITDQVRVMGEVSPYISSVKAEPELGKVVINGVRFNTLGSNKVTLYANGSVAKAFVLRTEAGSYLSFPLSYLTASNDGYYMVTVTNESLGNKNGLSNSIGFTYNGAVSTNNAGTISGTTAQANEVRFVDSGSDYVSSTSFSPGTGVYNLTKKDWHWAVRLTNDTDKTIRSLTLITKDNTEGWSTASGVNVKAGTALPLKVMTSSFANKQADEFVPVSKGATVINLWGQIEAQNFPGGTLTVTYTDGSVVTASVPASSVVWGQTSSTQTTPVTQTQSTQQSASSIPPQTNAVVAPAQDSVEAHVVDVGSDYVGIWNTWKPGRGNVNPTNKDWHWAARLTTSVAKTIQSVTVTNGSESWSTADVQVAGVPAYPLKFMSAYKSNTAVNDRFDVSAGSTVFNLWGQIEAPTYGGGTIRIVFTDGSSVAAQIPASPIKVAAVAVTSATVTNSTITEGIVSSSVTSGLPGSSVTLKLAGVKTPVTSNDINIGPYAAQNLVFNATTNEVTFTIPWDMVVGSYDLVWFGPTSSYVIKFNVLNKSTFNFNASDLVGSVIGVLKSLF